MTDEPATVPDEPQGAVVAPVTTEARRSTPSRGRPQPARRVRGRPAARRRRGRDAVRHPKWTFVVLATAAVCVGVWELCRALKAGGFNVPLVPSMRRLRQHARRGLRRRRPSAAGLLRADRVSAILVWRVADGVVGAARDVMGGALVAAYPLAPRRVLLAAARSGRRRVADVHLHRGHRRERHRRVRRGGPRRGGTRWRRRSVPRSRGRGSPVRWSSAWRWAWPASTSRCTARGGSGWSPARRRPWGRPRVTSSSRRIKRDLGIKDMSDSSRGTAA